MSNLTKLHILLTCMERTDHSQHKILNRIVLDALKKKRSKDEVYQELRVDWDDDTLRKILASRPSPSLSISQKIMHKFVCFVWVLLFLFDLIGLTDLYIQFDIKLLISFGVTTYLLVQIWRFHGDVFLPSVFWLCIGIYSNIIELAHFSPADPDYDGVVAVTLVLLFLMALTALLTYLLYRKVFGHFHWFRPKRNGWNQIIFEEDL